MVLGHHHPDTALRLARFFGTTPDLWLGLQAEFDLRVSERRSGAEIRRIPPLRSGPSGETRVVVRSRRSDALEVREPRGEYRIKPR